ncbi:MAG: methyltransferase domain-containing protein [Chloroflexota bacterium]|nr:methyltransferase domain-containing protein [Chloroflexota bacterium]
MPVSESERLQAVYAERQQRYAQSDVYSLFNPAYQFFVQQRQRAVLALLRANGLSALHEKSVLEVGCGGGSVLLEWLFYGVPARQLYGIDVLWMKLAHARAKNEFLNVAAADGQRLPFADGSFDVVTQYMAFSSILDDAVRQRVAAEMLRVLRPATGAILWYDFWFNPTNPDVRAIRAAEIRALFAGCDVTIQRITLAPPIARRLVGVSWLLCALLERIGILNTHQLALIRPK